jgi:hypothetical protein
MNDDLRKSTDGTWIWSEVCTAIEAGINACERFRVGLQRLTELKFPIPDGGSEGYRPWMAHVREVACGHLLPETFLALAGNKTLLDLVSGWPPEKQKIAGSGEPIAVVQPDGSVVKKTIGSMNKKERDVALDRSGPRPVEKQHDYIETSRSLGPDVEEAWERASLQFRNLRKTLLATGSYSAVSGPMDEIRRHIARRGESAKSYAVL